uniref:Uncharacterized protein n=1 Tax=Streptomyces violaceusniger TaxID=68280 RepID=A0A6F8Z233_STRVO|nr:hypothetical protein [Streptomyces violaceusniger]
MEDRKIEVWRPMAILLQVFISAGVAILIFVLGEVFIRQRARQAKKESIEATYQKYAEPLMLSASQLFWRLDEVFNPGGAGYYLQGHEHHVRYERYKTLSTLYRMASLLGWIRALRRELVFIRGSNPAVVKDLDGALESYASALADGRRVETRMVESLIHLWLIRANHLSPEVIAQAGIQTARQVAYALHEKQVSSVKYLSEADQLALSREIADSLTGALSCAPVADDLLKETIKRAVVYLSVREAWFYRDWQSGIGDLMIKQVKGSQRDFEIIGYKDFEEMCDGQEEVQLIWLRRLYAVIDDLDVDGDRFSDSRIDQLHETYLATAKMIEALHQSDSVQSQIPESTRNAVNRVLQAA